MGFVQKGRPSASFIYDYSRFSIPRVCCTPRPRRVDLSALDDASSQWLKAESPSNFQHRRVYSQIQPDDVLAGYTKRLPHSADDIEHAQHDLEA